MARLSRTLGTIALCGLLLSCGDEDSGDNKPQAGENDPLYLIGANVQTTNESVLYLWTSPALEGAKLDLKEATEMTGASDTVTFEGKVYHHTLWHSERSACRRRRGELRRTRLYLLVLYTHHVQRRARIHRQ
jgi:hypothetical protein